MYISIKVEQQFDEGSKLIFKYRYSQIQICSTSKYYRAYRYDMKAV